MEIICLLLYIPALIIQFLPFIIIFLVAIFTIKHFIKRKNNESNIMPIKKYIIANRETFSKTEIEETLLRAGWTKEQIDFAFKSIE